MEPLELESIVRHSRGRWVATSPLPALSVAELSTDTRALGNQSVFVALSGPNFDGHAFVSEARHRGAVASIVQSRRLSELPPSGGPYIVVDEPLEALERLARWNRERLSLSVIAVTGSVGKTSVKEFISTILGGAHSVKSAPKSFNNRIGVAMSILSAHPGTEVLVLEMGTSSPGEISHLSNLARPHRVVITEIAPAHLDGLGDLDGIVKAKAEIFDGLGDGGSAFVRHGVHGFDLLAAKARGPLLTFGWNKGDIAVTDCQRVMLGQDAHDSLVSADYGYHFTINGSENFLLPVPGRHNVLNAAAAIGVARDLGMSWELIRSQIASCRLPPLRFQVTEQNGLVLVDDSYNANPASMEAAIREWESIEWGVETSSRVAVLGDMLEMGPESLRLHTEIGKRLHRSGARLVVTVGNDSRWIGEACLNEGAHAETVHFASASEALPFLKRSLRSGDCVLFKGSRRIGLDSCVKAVREWACQNLAKST